MLSKWCSGVLNDDVTVKNWIIWLKLSHPSYANRFRIEFRLEGCILPSIWECKDSKFCYQPAGHIITENLKIISDSRIRTIISKDPNYRFPAHIDFTKCREAIAKALNGYCTRWCKREHVESNALNNWKLNIFQIIDKRISFYLNNFDLSPELSTFETRYPRIS